MSIVQPLSATDLKSLNKKQLRALCKQRGSAITGKEGRDVLLNIAQKFIEQPGSTRTEQQGQIIDAQSIISGRAVQPGVSNLVCPTKRLMEMNSAVL